MMDGDESGRKSNIISLSLSLSVCVCVTADKEEMDSMLLGKRRIDVDM